MIKLVYKPLSLLVSVLGGALASVIFKRIWKLAAGEDDAPKATDAQRGWREILPAAAVQGAVYAVVKAAVDRGAAEGTRKLTGVWPGENGEQAKEGGVTTARSAGNRRTAQQVNPPQNRKLAQPGHSAGRWSRPAGLTPSSTAAKRPAGRPRRGG